MNRFGVRRMAAVAGIAVTAVVAASIPASALTNASWRDTEWDHAAGLGTVNCAANDAFATRGAGKFLDANVLGLPLSNLADVKGVVVTKDGTDASVVDPVTATPAGNDAYLNPLTVTALNSALTLDLTNVLTLPLDAPTGALNQYGQAQSNGHSAGASGLVNDTGGLADLSTDPDPSTLPDVATLNLQDVVASIIGAGGAGAVADVANLNLSLGAVGASAQLDGCNENWKTDLANNLVRQYLIAALHLNVDSPLVGGLVTGVSGTVDDLEDALNNIGDGGSLDATITTGLTTGLSTLLDGLLGGLSATDVSANLSATYDFSGVTDLLTSTITDPTDGVVSINLGDGTVTVDLAKLLGGANGLNGLDPNTELLVNSAVINNLTDAVVRTIQELVDQLEAAVTASLDAITLSGTVSLSADLLAFDVIDATVTLTNVSLASLLTNSGDAAHVGVVVNVASALGCPANVLDPLFVAEVVLCPVLSTVTDGLTNGIQAVIGATVQGLLTPITATLNATLDALPAITNPLVVLLDSLLSGLFGVNGVASVLVNVQNDPLTGNAEPGDWSSSQIPVGRYDVAAIRIGVLGLLGTNHDLDVVLARGSVGVNGPAS